MKIFEKIKNLVKDGTEKASSIVPHSELSTEILCNHVVPKTAKHLNWSLVITAHTQLKIKKISYEIVEIVDPIIWKDKNEAEALWTLEVKKWFALTEDERKELDFKIPIHFANEHRKESTWWDMKLLNQMSERSKKTAINYDLKILITYILPNQDDPETKKIKFDIGFE